MAKKKNDSLIAPKDTNSSDGDEYKTGGLDSFGNSPEVDEKDLTAENRVVTSIDQGINLSQQDINDARKLIINARRITAKKQGAPPYDPAKLKQQGKSGAKRNISTRFLQKELNRAAPRLFMPVLTASTLTAASLPAGWPKGQEKTKFFRETITQAIRGWRKNDMFWRGMAQEVVDYGYGFSAWTDPYEWRPHLCRMDRGFVPRGTEIMDDKLPRFTLKWDYQPGELLKLARAAVDAGSDNWKKDAVAAACDGATLPTLPQDMSQLRKWEELIREQSWDYNYTKSSKVVETWHQFILEYTGKVTHYIYWPAGKGDFRLLYEKLDARDDTDSVVIPMTFGYGDGTIHGSWGAGQLLYDLAAQVEKIRNDSMDNLLNSNKARLQVANAKDMASAQLVINDTMIIATGATFAQNVGGITGNPEGYLAMDKMMTQWAQEIVGSYLPPLPSQSSKAATDIANEAIGAEQQVQKDVLENWMKQVALVIAQMVRRMMDPDSDDDYAQAVRKKLLGDNVGWIQSLWNKARRSIKLLEKITPPPPIALTEEELDILVNQPVIQSVTDFTPYAAQQRGAFAASVQNNPLFNQSAVARYMAEGVANAGEAFVDSIVVSDGDTSSQTAQQRQQSIESATMLTTNQSLPVIPTDNHIVHWGILEPQLELAIQAGNIKAATAGLQHLSAHYAAGVSGKTWPPDQINSAKARLAQLQRALEAKTQEQQQAQAAQQQQSQQQPSQADLQAREKAVLAANAQQQQLRAAQVVPFQQAQ